MVGPRFSEAQAVLAEARREVESVADVLADEVQRGGKIDAAALEVRQPEAFTLARHLAEIEAADALLAWGAGQGAGELEAGLTQWYVASFTASVHHRSWERGGGALGKGAQQFVRTHLDPRGLAALGALILERDTAPGGVLGIGGDHLPIQREFARFSDEQVAPRAEEIHRHDRLIPEELLADMAQLGVFGISIPEEHGGNFVDHRTMIIATEELSRGSLGAGGSVITRPEICAKAILAGGTEAQKEKWLPLLASGEKVVSVAVTEPDAGSDVASLRVTAKRVDGGFVIHGEKTWCTFAGRADVFVLLARTGSLEEGHRGLTLFLVEKPATKSGEGDEYSFAHEDSRGGRCEGRAIPTIGYRGMHSFSVVFEDWFVPEGNQVGETGRGFYLQMKGFEGGRIQTAARAVGLMEAAFRAAITYAKDRRVFGKALAELPLTRIKLAKMAAHIQAGRQLAYMVGLAMDVGQGSLQASLVKFLTCKDAEWVTREAMQIHGGMGYSEEYAVSRYWQDARVLSIFEGAEEVLGVLVIARQYLASRLAG